MYLCEFMFYKEYENCCPILYCKANNDKQCIFSKKCLKLDKWIPLEEEKWKECYIMIEEKVKNIPKDSYYVQTYRPNKKGFLYLYVVIGNKVEKILSELKELNQEYVYLKKENDTYKISLVPFVEKKNYVKKNNKVEEK